MDGNLSSGNMIPSPTYGVLDLQGPLYSHHQHGIPVPIHQNPHHHQDMFPITIGGHFDSEQSLHMSGFRACVNVERGAKNLTSDEDEPSYNEDGHVDEGKEKKGSLWHRMKWTDSMVKLLITVVSYIGEDLTSECVGNRRKRFAVLQKKGKWKTVSKVMAARGCYVSPQQCEDKFNDLNKRYKRLTDVLGKGTSCKVVENPVLLESMDHLSEKMKDDVRKILSSKHLFYEEMCSYHNGNRLHLLDDPSLVQCLQTILKGKNAREEGKQIRREIGREKEDDDDVDEDEYGDDETNQGEDLIMPQKRFKVQNTDEGNFWPPASTHDFTKTFGGENISMDMNEPVTGKATWMQREEWIKNRALQLEEQKLSIQAQELELEMEHFKWQRFSRRKDRDLEKLRLENERMKLENERFSLELRHIELELGFSRSDAVMPALAHTVDRLQ